MSEPNGLQGASSEASRHHFHIRDRRASTSLHLDDAVPRLSSPQRRLVRIVAVLWLAVMLFGPWLAMWERVTLLAILAYAYLLFTGRWQPFWVDKRNRAVGCARKVLDGIASLPTVARQNFKESAAALTALSYAVVYVSYERFYEVFSVDPRVVGLGTKDLLVSSIGLLALIIFVAFPLVVVAFIVCAMFVIYARIALAVTLAVMRLVTQPVIDILAEVADRRPQSPVPDLPPERLRLRIRHLVVLAALSTAVAVTVLMLTFAPKTAKEIAQAIRAGEPLPRSEFRFMGFAILGVRADPAWVAPKRDTTGGAGRLTTCYFYLGESSGLYTLYDPRQGTTIRVPVGEVTLFIPPYELRRTRRQASPCGPIRCPTIDHCADGNGPTSPLTTESSS